MALTLFILAAGMGSRFGSLKQLAPLGPSGETLMDYTIYDALQQGFDKVVFIIRHDFEEAFQQQVLSKYQGRVGIALAYQTGDACMPQGFTHPERSKPWGTVHALLCAEKELNAGPFVLVNADDFYGRSAFQAMAAHFKRTAGQAGLWAIAGYPLSITLPSHGTVTRGLCVAGLDGHMENLLEVKGVERHEGVLRCPDSKGGFEILPADMPVSMNCIAFTPDVFGPMRALFHAFLDRDGQDPKSELAVPTAVDAIVKMGQAKVALPPVSGPWFGVTNPEDSQAVKESLRQLVDQGVYPSPLFA
jgi:hypothetical protein